MSTKSVPMTRIVIKRAYDDPDPQDGYRVLIDRMWPRGHTRESLRLDRQAPELAPSVTLRKWFSHDPDRWTQFRECYERQLKDEAMQLRMKELLAAANGRQITLVFGAKDVMHNHAIILQATL